MELKGLLREIHWIEWQLRKFEDRYAVRSEDFYKAMEAGELADFDDIDDPHFHDFMEWHGLCKAWHWRQETYQDLLRRHSLVEQLRTAPMAAWGVRC